VWVSFHGIKITDIFYCCNIITLLGVPVSIYTAAILLRIYNLAIGFCGEKQVNREAVSSAGPFLKYRASVSLAARLWSRQILQHRPTFHV